MEATQAQLANFQQQLVQLQQQLFAALARAERAETERTQALNLAAAAAQQAAASAQQAATAATADPLANRPLVDNKNLGQPPKLKRRDLLPNWSEWKHKPFVFVGAHFKQQGKRVVEAMRWAETQRKQIEYENTMMDSRVIGWSYEFSEEIQTPDRFIQHAQEGFAALFPPNNCIRRGPRPTN